MVTACWQKIRSSCRPLLRLTRHELWEPNGWMTMGFTWLWLFWCVFPGLMIIKYQMESGNHIAFLVCGGGFLLFYGASRGLVEANSLYQGKVWSIGEFFIFLLLSLPPLLIGGLLSMGGIIALLQKLFGFSS